VYAPFLILKIMQQRTHWVMDYETLSNCFVAVFTDYKSNWQEVFVVHLLRNDFQKFLEFLHRNIKKNEWHISFNGLGFDAQITQHILENQEYLLSLPAQSVAQWIYGKAQDIIECKNRGEFLEFQQKNISIKQIDVFKLNHWDNPAKSSSLKWIQFSMDWHNLQDMPISHTTMILKQDQIDDIISYCINDVASTKQIMQLSTDQIKLRKTLTEEYNIDLYSASEPRISKELFLHFLSKATGYSKWELKNSRTKRTSIKVKDLILPYVKFDTPDFDDIRQKFESLVINPEETKNAFHYSLKHKKVTTDFGLGGLHGARRSGIYEENENMIIMSSDVVSFYPNLAIVNKWAPAHIPKQAFCDQYEWFFKERKKISKSDPRNYVYKIILNSTYGLSNDKNAFLYDPQLTMSITINGQLSLLMLYEMLSIRIPDSVPIMQNTDGLEIIIPRTKKELYLNICSEWEKITGLQLEHDMYKKIILADVNNYIGVFSDGKTKCKGRFEFENLMLHKNKSFLIVRKAIYNYFINNTPIEETIKSSRNIFDFCGAVKAKRGWYFTETCFVNGERTDNVLQKTIRYYVSQPGCKILKNHEDSREIQVEAGRWLQTVYNKHEEKSWEDYNIDYRFYIQKANKEFENVLHVMEDSQLKLF
jgi:hypothetical protein